MKCSKCGDPLADSGYVLTLVAPGDRVLTATVHLLCLDDIVGPTVRRRLDKLCFMAGWKQAKLPFDHLVS